MRLTLPRPSHPASNVRDDREAPLMWERDSENCKFDLGLSRSDLFSRERLDNFSKRSSDLPVVQSHKASHCEKLEAHIDLSFRGAMQVRRMARWTSSPASNAWL
jgi:hypothetical protein